jgi:hypothetical protein
VSEDYAERMCAMGQIEMGGMITVYSTEEDPASAHGKWDFSQPLPVPKFSPMCPWCSSEDSMIRAWAGTGDHMMVSFKCLGCGLVTYADIRMDPDKVAEMVHGVGAELGQDIPWQAAQDRGVVWK